MKIKTLLWTSNGLMLGFILALVAFAYSTVHLTLVPAIASTDKAANTINLAGRQRMLSQKMSKEIELANAGDAAALKAMQETQATFGKTLDGLLTGSEDMGLAAPGNAAIEKELKATKALWDKFQPHVLNLLNRIPESNTSTVEVEAASSKLGRKLAALGRALGSSSVAVESEEAFEAASNYLEESRLGLLSLEAGNGGADELAKAREIASAVSNSLSKVGSTVEGAAANGELKGLAKEVASLGSTYEATVKSALEVYGSRNESLAYIRANNVPLLKQMNAAVGEWTTFSGGFVVHMIDSAKRSFQLELALGVVALFCGVAMSLYIFRRINRPIETLLSAIDRLAKGDLSGEVDIHSKDELGVVAEELNETIVKWRAMVKGLLETSSSLASSSEELSAISSELAISSENVGTRTATVASAGEQLSSTMETMSTSAREMSEVAGSIATAVEELNASISEVARNCSDETARAGEASEKTKEAKKLMDELGACAENVDKVVGMVNRISEHTNLLALNATIEAASAGAAGKGFAVVASEVKKLAHEAAESNKEISEQMKQIQRFSQQSITSIDLVARMIEEVNSFSQSIAAAIEEQTATTREISHAVNQSNQRVMEVSRGVEESSSGARDVSQNILQVSEAVRQSAEAASQTKSSSDELSRMAQKLSSMVGEFRV